MTHLGIRINNPFRLKACLATLTPHYFGKSLGSLPKKKTYTLQAERQLYPTTCPLSQFEILWHRLKKNFFLNPFLKIKQT